MRALVMLLACAGLACSRAASSSPSPGLSPARQDTAGGAGARVTGQGQQEPREPRPYNRVITDRAVTDSGIFLVHRIGDRLYYEIPRAMLGREFRLVVDRRGTMRGVGYAGEQISARVVRWDRMDNRVLLRMISYAMRADTALPVSRSVDLSNTPPIIKSFEVAAWSPRDSNAVIDVTSLFTTDVPELNARQLRLRVRRFDPGRSLVERAKSFPLNVEVTALHTFEVDSIPGAPGSGWDRTVNSITIPTNYSMVLLPGSPMQPRLCDNRVGFFSVSYEDYGADEPRVPRRCYITRWRLEPRDSTAAVTDPMKPIVFYLDPATPEKWASWIIKGVQMWEPVFRAAGFSNAITARRAPTEAEDPEFDLDDARYSTIRWLPSTIENAYGPHVNDPRTGEILQSNIGWFHNITSLLQAWYWAQAGAVDPRARRLPFPDSLMGEMVAYVSAHEVGHTLGLPHNQLASGYYPVDSLRSASYTRRHGTSYSIMDYARNNYVAQPGDSAELMPKIGVWDHYVIDWGYRRIPGARRPQDERSLLDSLARLQDANPWFRFGNPDGIDPRTQTEALGDDPIKATTYGLANLKRLVPMLIPAATTNQLEDYDLLRDLYGRLIGQWGLEMNHVAVVVGGVHRHEKYPTQSGVIHTPVPRARQAAAVRFLHDNAFTTPGYFLDPAVLRRIEPSGFVDRIRVRQAAVLNQLFNDGRLARLAEQQATLPPGTAYTLPDLFADVRRGIFAEVAGAGSVDPYRRNLQQAFVDQMERLITTPLTPPVPPQFAAFGITPTTRPADARALARLELQGVQAMLRAAIARGPRDRMTRAHYVDLEARIDRILNPS
ncbi:MAG: zinc-dependent metalloprotease [Gemmatimonadales bacterium]